MGEDALITIGCVLQYREAAFLIKAMKCYAEDTTTQEDAHADKTKMCQLAKENTNRIPFFL